MEKRKSRSRLFLLAVKCDQVAPELLLSLGEPVPSAREGSGFNLIMESLVVIESAVFVESRLATEPS